MTVTPKPTDGRKRVVVERVLPDIDCGRFAAKAVVGDAVLVQADVVADGHDDVAVELLWRADGETGWHVARMGDPVNDRWVGSFPVTSCGRYGFTVRAWVDRFASWSSDLAKRLEGGQEDVSQELLVGAGLVQAAARRASGRDEAELRAWAKRLKDVAKRAARTPSGTSDPSVPRPELAELMSRYPDRRHASTYALTLPVEVDRPRARFSAWYELFPRSAADEPGRHGTFKDVERRLPYVANMGFDVLYLPPVHPIGARFRKGRNNTVDARTDDPGSPWAIGAKEGGHTAIHPRLGTLTDFEHLVARAQDFGMEIAMDLAYQCSADHPWLTEHPEWFRRRADGSIRYAENPPKKYQDIYPLNFETPDWKRLWDALKQVAEFWVERGVRIFRVDNPHTKPFAFWEWLIPEVKRDHPDVIFLSEAFTRPKVMHRLAKLGFTQSYTYFTWRNTKQELTEYFGRDLPAVRDFFRPNLWPNTPDILHETLQAGGRPAFVARLILAATLGASYGIYGPAFELMESVPVAQGKEEYLNSEKYEIRHWDLDRPDSLAELIGRVNRIRRENPALHRDDTLRLVDVDNEELFAYAKTSPDGSNIILVVVNLDPRNRQAGTIDVPIHEWSAPSDVPYRAIDLLTGAAYTWQGWRNFVMLDPDVVPAHVLRIEPHADADAAGRG